MEPLQEQETHIIAQLEEENTSIEGETLLQEEITTHIVEVLIEKAAYMREKGKELAEMFHSLEKVVQGACTT